MKQTNKLDVDNIPDNFKQDVGDTNFFFSSRIRHTRLSGDWSSDVCSSDLVLDGHENAFQLPAFQDGLFEIQDEGSQLLALAVGARPGWTVVDACAGAGGKSLALAAEMHGKGSLVALD